MNIEVQATRQPTYNKFPISRTQQVMEQAKIRKALKQYFRKKSNPKFSIPTDQAVNKRLENYKSKMTEIYKKNLDERCGSFMDKIKNIDDPDLQDYYHQATRYSIDLKTNEIKETFKLKDESITKIHRNLKAGENNLVDTQVDSFQDQFRDFETQSQNEKGGLQAGTTRLEDSRRGTQADLKKIVDHPEIQIERNNQDSSRHPLQPEDANTKHAFASMGSQVKMKMATTLGGDPKKTYLDISYFPPNLNNTSHLSQTSSLRRPMSQQQQPGPARKKTTFLKKGSQAPPNQNSLQFVRMGGGGLRRRSPKSQPRKFSITHGATTLMPASGAAPSQAEVIGQILEEPTAPIGPGNLQINKINVFQFNYNDGQPEMSLGVPGSNSRKQRLKGSRRNYTSHGQRKPTIEETFQPKSNNSTKGENFSSKSFRRRDNHKFVVSNRNITTDYEHTNIDAKTDKNTRVVTSKGSFTSPHDSKINDQAMMPIIVTQLNSQEHSQKDDSIQKKKTFPVDSKSSRKPALSNERPSLMGAKLNTINDNSVTDCDPSDRFHAYSNSAEDSIPKIQNVYSLGVEKSREYKIKILEPEMASRVLAQAEIQHILSPFSSLNSKGAAVRGGVSIPGFSQAKRTGKRGEIVLEDESSMVESRTAQEQAQCLMLGNIDLTELHKMDQMIDNSIMQEQKEDDQAAPKAKEEEGEIQTQRPSVLFGKFMINQTERIFDEQKKNQDLPLEIRNISPMVSIVNQKKPLEMTMSQYNLTTMDKMEGSRDSIQNFRKQYKNFKGSWYKQNTSQNRFRSVQKQAREKADTSLFQTALCTRPKILNLKKQTQKVHLHDPCKKTDKLTSPMPAEKTKITEPDLAKTVVVSKQQTPVPSGDLFKVPKINSQLAAKSKASSRNEEMDQGRRSSGFKVQVQHGSKRESYNPYQDSAVRQSFRSQHSWGQEQTHRRLKTSEIHERSKAARPTGFTSMNLSTKLMSGRLSKGRLATAHQQDIPFKSFDQNKGKVLPEEVHQDIIFSGRHDTKEKEKESEVVIASQRQAKDQRDPQATLHIDSTDENPTSREQTKLSMNIKFEQSQPLSKAGLGKTKRSESRQFKNTGAISPTMLHALRQLNQPSYSNSNAELHFLLLQRQNELSETLQTQKISIPEGKTLQNGKLVLNTHEDEDPAGAAPQVESGKVTDEKPRLGKPASHNKLARFLAIRKQRLIQKQLNKFSKDQDRGRTTYPLYFDMLISSKENDEVLHSQQSASKASNLRASEVSVVEKAIKNQQLLTSTLGVEDMPSLEQTSKPSPAGRQLSSQIGTRQNGDIGSPVNLSLSPKYIKQKKLSQEDQTKIQQAIHILRSKTPDQSATLPKRKDSTNSRNLEFGASTLINKRKSQGSLDQKQYSYGGAIKVKKAKKFDHAQKFLNSKFNLKASLAHQKGKLMIEGLEQQRGRKMGRNNLLQNNLIQLDLSQADKAKVEALFRNKAANKTEQSHNLGTTLMLRDQRNNIRVMSHESDLRFMVTKYSQQSQRGGNSNVDNDLLSSTQKANPISPQQPNTNIDDLVNDLAMIQKMVDEPLPKNIKVPSYHHQQRQLELQKSPKGVKGSARRPGKTHVRLQNCENADIIFDIQNSHLRFLQKSSGDGSTQLDPNFVLTQDPDYLLQMGAILRDEFQGKEAIPEDNSRGGSTAMDNRAAERRSFTMQSNQSFNNNAAA